MSSYAQGHPEKATIRLAGSYLGGLERTIADGYRL